MELILKLIAPPSNMFIINTFKRHKQTDIMHINTIQQRLSISWQQV